MMAYKPGGKQPNQLPYNKNIANRVREMAPTHSVAKIHEAILHMQNAPRSYTTFYKLYGKDLTEARDGLITKVGNLVYDNALRTDEEAKDNPLVQKDRHFILERKGGWNKTETVQNREVGQEHEDNESAVSALMGLLGKDVEEDTNEE